MTNISQRKIYDTNHNYAGQYNDLQVYGNSLLGKRYARIEQDYLTESQMLLFNRALYGLNVYSSKEIKLMRKEKIKRIVKVHKRAQTVLNIWKQQTVNLMSTQFFTFVFPNTPLTNDFINTINDVDPEYDSDISFDTLGITKKHIINKLINERILPSNFYNI